MTLKEHTTISGRMRISVFYHDDKEATQSKLKMRLAQWQQDVPYSTKLIQRAYIVYNEEDEEL